MEGTISLKEYYDALEAYSCSGEEHYPLDDEDYHIPFDQRALFKLIDILQERQISYDDLFAQCDQGGDGVIDVKELSACIGDISPLFGIKDIHSLQNFFDVDKDGTIDKNEFINGLKKGE